MRHIVNEAWCELDGDTFSLTLIKADMLQIGLDLHNTFRRTNEHYD